MRGLYGAQIPGQLTLRSEWWIAGLAISVLGALAAAAASLLKAARLPVLVAAQPQAWQQAQQRWLMFQSAVALAVFAAAGFLLWYGDSLLSGFAVLAALLLAAALLLPAILERVLSLGQRSARRPLAVWFWADSRQQLSGLSLALMALLLALAVNVGVGTMVESFSRTFVGWLDGRLAADVYVSAKDDAQAIAIKAWLRGRPEVEAILPGGRADAQFRGAPIEVLGLPDHATYSEHWPLLESTANAWVRLRPGDAALVSEQLSRRLKLGIGDRIEVPAPGGNWPLEIVGIYADYGNPKGQIAVNYAALTRRFPAIPATRFGLRVAPSGNSGAAIGAARKIRPRRPQPRRSGHHEGRVETDLQSDLCGDRGAQHLHPRGRRHCAVDQPADPEQFPAAAAGAVVGDRNHAAAAGGDRADQDPVGGADHGAAGAAARPCWWRGA